MTSRPIRRIPTTGDSPLTINDVYEQVCLHAATQALTTAEIREHCQNAHRDYPPIPAHRVLDHLSWLHRQRRVRSWTGKDRHPLSDLGVNDPDRQARYWALPAPQEPR